MAYDNTILLVPTEAIWNRDAGYDVVDFNDWHMASIINHFLEMENNGDLTLYEKIRFRRALLVSYEAGCIARRERFYV